MRQHCRDQERTCFQESGPFDPRLDSRADVAIVYGINATFEERVDQWRLAGYRVHVMTGVAWGGYQDYVRGEWDGKPHYDDAQTAAGDFRLEHGMSQGHDCFYMMPSRAYARYLGQKLRRVVDAGADAIHLEEPEFWVRAGYSEGFRREWREFYGEPWQDPTSSPDARYRAGRLMQHLYTRALEYLFAELKEYAAARGRPDFRCYVPTHSLLNYAHWRIVSPESRMLALAGCDGIVGQVWTGTSRTPTVYEGVKAQRTFEAGFCEYAACTALVRGTDQRLWVLADPIEDNPNFCWDDYRQNWESTVVASLLVPEADRFEIMPWPRRIFTGTYPAVNLVSEPLEPLWQAYLARLEREGRQEQLAHTRRAFELMLDFYHRAGAQARQETLGFADLAEAQPEAGALRFGDLWSVAHGFYAELADWDDQEEAQHLRDAAAAFYHDPTDQRCPIPAGYAAELQTVFAALGDMAWPDHTDWVHGQPGVALALADSLMFQRGEPEASDADMSSVYGFALPLVKAGVPLAAVQLERLTVAEHVDAVLDGVRVLVLTYEGQKPPSAAAHEALAAWVRAGGGLVLWGQGDAYDQVREWWNEDGAWDRPQQHLTDLLGLGRDAPPGLHACGAGYVAVDPASPAALAWRPGGATEVLSRVADTCRALGLTWQTGSALALRRGPYVVAAGVAEATAATPAPTAILEGRFADLFSPRLEVRRRVAVEPGARLLLRDLDWSGGEGDDCEAAVVAAAGRVRDERAGEGELSFVLEGMSDTEAAVRVALPARSRTAGPVVAVGQSVADGSSVPLRTEVDEDTGTALIGLPHQAGGVAVQVTWQRP